MKTTRVAEEVSELIAAGCRNTNSQTGQCKPYLVAIDGPCASGKTVLAQELIKQLENIYRLRVSLIEMDHFFLLPALRTEARFEEPGGNIHYERFQEEVIRPLEVRKLPVYRVFDCSVMDYVNNVTIKDSDVIIVEGVYSHHPLWQNSIDLRIFCQAELDERLLRIADRDGQDKLKRFINEWIPMEDKYFNTFRINEHSDIIFQSDSCRHF